MQRRYLSDALLELHKKYLSSSDFIVSYSTFCKLRPFWILHPKVTARDTCLCITHENMKLLIQGMYSSKLIKQITIKQVLTSLCCNIENEDCLLRKCQLCKDKKIEYNSHESNSIIYWRQWVTEKETKISGKNKEGHYCDSNF